MSFSISDSRPSGIVATQENPTDKNKKDKIETEHPFTQVSQDMSELVYHLNSIQNDISELAGRPISLTKMDDDK